MKKRIGVVHTLFACQDCEATFGKHKNAQALAARHARHYNHYVTGEVVLAVCKRRSRTCSVVQRRPLRERR